MTDYALDVTPFTTTLGLRTHPTLNPVRSVPVHTSSSSLTMCETFLGPICGLITLCNHTVMCLCLSIQKRTVIVAIVMPSHPVFF